MHDDYPSELGPDTPPLGRSLKILGSGYLLGLVLVPLIVFGGILLVLILARSTAPATKSSSGPALSRESGVETARQLLIRQTDSKTCSSALQKINSELGEDPSLSPPALTAEQKKWLRDNLDLNGDERKEVEASHFTLLDNHHLFRCFLMRDVVANTLMVKGVRGKAGGPAVREQPLDQAARAFAWVMRQVRLRPSEGDTEPPSYVVRRGWGTAFERALVFLALLEQIGDPNAAEREVLGLLLQAPDKAGNKRLWACGVVVGDGKEVYLFDPSLGLPLPGPKGEGIATLAQACRQPEVLAQLNGGDKHPYPVTMEQARTAQAQLVYPLSALAPRVRYLQDKLLAPAVRVRLAGDAANEAERIKAAYSAGSEKPVPVLAPREMCTVLRRFLPADQGGSDTTQQAMRRFMGNLVPWNTLPPEFQNEQLFPTKSALRKQVHDRFAIHFLSWAIDPGSPRELLLRGRYSSAVEKLVTESDALRRQMEQRANAVNLGPQFQKWWEGAIKAYARQVTAKSPQEREQADKQVNAVWTEQSSWPIHIIINSSAAVVRNLEVAYQLGLCSQEQAEQLQARLDLQARIGAAPFKADVENAHAAWEKALGKWQRFDQDAPQQHSDRPAARLLRARAESMLGDRLAAIASWKAVASWKNEPGAPTDLERTAALYLAGQAEKKRNRQDGVPHEK